MKILPLSLALGCTLALASCAIAPQKPKTFNQLGQFATYPLNSHIYRVNFKTNSDMSYGVAEEITLVKAAQTTVQNGFRYFKVLNDPSNQSQRPPRQTIVYPANNFYPYGFYRRYPPGFAPDPFYNMPQVVNIDPIEVSYSIECFKEQTTATKDAFDATLILRSLGQKYGLTPTGDVLPPPLPAAKATNTHKTE